MQRIFFYVWLFTQSKANITSKLAILFLIFYIAKFIYYTAK